MIPFMKIYLEDMKGFLYISNILFLHLGFDYMDMFNLLWFIELYIKYLYTLPYVYYNLKFKKWIV